MPNEQRPVGETAAEDLRNALQLMKGFPGIDTVREAEARITSALTKLDSGEQPIRAAYGVRRPVGIAPATEGHPAVVIICTDGSVFEAVVAGTDRTWRECGPIPGTPAAIEQERRARTVDAA